MIDTEKIMMLEEIDLKEFSEKVEMDHIEELVELLNEKDNKIRYNALKILENRSANFDDVYPFFEIFTAKLTNENSYERNIGLKLIAANAKWDKENKLDSVINEYLDLLNDIKPITVRSCIQEIKKIIPYKSNLSIKIARSLMNKNILEEKETMRKLVLIDILNVLLIIRKIEPLDEIDDYILHALSGGILDKKAKVQIEKMLKSL